MGSETLTGLQITRKLVNVSTLLVGDVGVTGLLLILMVHLKLLQSLLLFRSTLLIVPPSDWIVSLT